MKTYQGSCHCGAIRYEVDIEFGQGMIRCNCSICTKLRLWSVIAKPASFRLLSGVAELTKYQFHTKKEQHFFCSRCGLRPFGIGNSPRWGEFYAVNVACLDDVSVEELVDAPAWTTPEHLAHWAQRPLRRMVGELRQAACVSGKG